MRIKRLIPEFVETIPDTLEPGKLYVSMQFATAAHSCCCGCGQEVITPLSKTDWQLYFNGEEISLRPSIGNWAFPCKSHYWIRNSSIEWAASWNDLQIKSARAKDKEAKRNRNTFVRRITDIFRT